MRTTIRINEQLLNEAKKAALASNLSLTALIETALKEKLLKQQKPGKKKSINLPTFKGHGIHPGVDLDDSTALLDLMDGV